MPLPSIGFTWTIIWVNEATFSSGATMTVPEMVLGSSRPIIRGSATIDVYSVPGLPATSATTGPGRAPLTTATCRLVAESIAAGMLMTP